MFKKNQIRAQRFINTITENFQSSKKNSLLWTKRQIDKKNGNTFRGVFLSTSDYWNIQWTPSNFFLQIFQRRKNESFISKTQFSFYSI